MNCDTATATVTVLVVALVPVDSDGDGVTDIQEALDGTNPNNPCDYKVASQDLTKVSTSWKSLDCDSDGLTNNEEVTGIDDPATPANPKGIKTDPRNPDSDGDGVTDGQEALDGTNPNNPCSFKLSSQDLTKVSTTWKTSDCDGDGVTNAQELLDKTDPNNPCSSVPAHVTLPLSQTFLSGDCDGDGLSNGEEIGPNSNSPFDPNNNGIPDYLEINNNKPSEDDLEIFNSVSPNADGQNDVFVIRGIENYPNNTVTIFNRFGVEVYQVAGYGQNDNFFNGYSEGRSTVNRDMQLPEGTYFYILRYVNKTGVEKQRSGYLFIKR